MPRIWFISFALLALVGFADALYLSLMHFYSADVGCSVITGCDAVLSSEYAVIMGVPLAYLGVVYYLVLLVTLTVFYQSLSPRILKAILVILSGAVLFSFWLIYLQAVVISAFCQYCLLSAAITAILFGLTVFATLRQPAETGDSETQN